MSSKRLLMIGLFAVAVAVLAMGAVAADDADGKVTDVFDDGTFEYYVTSEEPNEVKVNGLKCAGDDLDLTIPATVTDNGTEYTVVSIDPGIDGMAKNIAKLELPDTIRTIGMDAFLNSDKLTEITLKPGLTESGTSAFQGCTGLTAISIPDTVTKIGDGAFYGCTGIGSISLPDTLESLGKHAFFECKKLTLANMTLPSGIDSIRNATFAFSGITGTLTIPSNIATIEESAFSNCKNLTGVTLNDSLKTIGNNAFLECTGITDGLTIPGTVTSIGDYSFRGCTQIPMLAFGSGTGLTIGNSAFYK